MQKIRRMGWIIPEGNVVISNLVIDQGRRKFSCDVFYENMRESISGNVDQSVINFLQITSEFDVEGEGVKALTSFDEWKYLSGKQSNTAVPKVNPWFSRVGFEKAANSLVFFDTFMVSNNQNPDGLECPFKFSSKDENGYYNLTMLKRRFRKVVEDYETGSINYLDRGFMAAEEVNKFQYEFFCFRKFGVVGELETNSQNKYF